MASSVSTSPKPIVDAVLGIYRTEALYAAVKFNIPDTVHQLEPNAELNSIALKLDLPKSTLQRLLDACVAMGIIDVTKSDHKDVYFTTAMTKEWLLSSSEQSLTGYVKFYSYLDEIRYKVSQAVELGENRLKDIPDIFQLSADNPEMAINFTEGMAAISQTTKSLTLAFDLGKYKTAIDVAGGVGVIADALKKCYPQMTVSVLELPVTVSEAEKYWMKRGGLPDIKFISGDMFESPLPQADLYILGHVLHDFPDEKCEQILSNISKSIKPDGAVLLLEKLLPDTPSPDKLTSYVYEMCMLTVPLLAKERTLKEYRHFLERADFGDFQWRGNSENPLYDAILAIKND